MKSALERLRELRAEAEQIEGDGTAPDGIVQSEECIFRLLTCQALGGKKVILLRDQRDWEHLPEIYRGLPFLTHRDCHHLDGCDAQAIWGFACTRAAFPEANVTFTKSTDLIPF